MKLLVVGSNPLLHRLVFNVLSDPALELRNAQSVEDALQSFSNYSPDFVLTEANVTEIKMSYPSASVILLADYEDPELRVQAFSNGASHYVMKEEMFFLAGLMKSLPGS